MKFPFVRQEGVHEGIVCEDDLTAKKNPIIIADLVMRANKFEKF